MPAQELVRLFEGLKQRALKVWPQDQARPVSSFQARLLMDAVLTNLMFGWLPPMRTGVFRSLLLPGSDTLCTSPDCQASSEGQCRGNRVVREAGVLGLSIAHHKNESR